MTTLFYLTSQAQRSQEFTSQATIVITSQFTFNGQYSHPFFFSPDGLVALIPPKAWDDRVVGQEKFSVPQPAFYLSYSCGPAVVPVGTGTGNSQIRVSLVNQGGPIKSSWDGEPYKRNENPKPVSPLIFYSPIIEFLSYTESP
jgi:hypothetical protein